MTRSRLPIYLMAITSVLIAIGSYRFLFLDMSLAFAGMIGHIDQRPIAFLIHISLAPVALVLGAYQMFRRQNGSRGAVHRWLGRGYGLAILISGIAGLIIAIGAEGGMVAAAGFGLLSILWVTSTALAIRYAMARNIAAHRRWMVVSFALTFAGVTLRVYLLGFVAAGFTYTEASPYLAWLCWVPNLVFAQWWLGRRRTL